MPFALMVVAITLVSNGVEMFCNVSLFLEQIRATEKVTNFYPTSQSCPIARGVIDSALTSSVR